MLCTVYKTAKKQQTFLFVKQRDNFSDVPEALMKMFGTPTLVTVFNLANKDKLGLADIEKVKQALTESGYYLQLPPPEENLLDEHRSQQKQFKATQNSSVQANDEEV